MIKNAYIGIIGKPNVGKSSLINCITKKKTSIVSFKPQTTRNLILGDYINKDNHFVFIDSPGFHTPNNKLDNFMNSQVRNTFKFCDYFLFLFDLTREIDQEDKDLISQIKKFNIENYLVVLTKTDVVDQNRINKFINLLKLEIPFDNYFAISSKNNVGIDKILSFLDEHIDENDKVLDMEKPSDDFIIKEIIREQIIFNTKQEIPYATNIEIENKSYENNLFTINASIVVEKESQKHIIIGAGGSMIKKIGTYARKELLEIFDCKIMLKLFVKCEKDWRNNERYIRENKY